jgi:Tat protein translocase TatB subunit
MIEISLWKLLLVLMVGLIVLGPKHLPKMAKMIGSLVAQLRSILNSAKKEYDHLALDDKKDERAKVTVRDDR